jgi:hypothetical protein
MLALIVEAEKWPATAARRAPPRRRHRARAHAAAPPPPPGRPGHDAATPMYVERAARFDRIRRHPAGRRPRACIAAVQLYTQASAQHAVQLGPFLATFQRAAPPPPPTPPRSILPGPPLLQCKFSQQLNSIIPGVKRLPRSRAHTLQPPSPTCKSAPRRIGRVGQKSAFVKPVQVPPGSKKTRTWPMIPGVFFPPGAPILAGGDWVFIGRKIKWPFLDLEQNVPT